MTEVLKPSQIIEAIKYAISKDPNDKAGDKAFRIDPRRIRNGNNGVRYLTFEVLKKDKNNNWDYVPINIKFKNLITKAHVVAKPSNDPNKKSIPGCRLQFHCNSSTYKEKSPDKKDGKDHYYDEPYGRVKGVIAKAFLRIMSAHLKEKKITNGNKKLACGIQFEFEDDKTHETKKLDDPIIRVEVSFKKQKDGNVILADEKPKCNIYNAEQKLTPEESKDKECIYAPALLKTDAGEVPITYSNIAQFIRPGSSISGVDDYSSISLSSMGISLSSRINGFIIVKPSKGYRPVVNSVFSTDDLNSMSGAETVDQQEEATTQESNTVVSNDAFDDITNGISDELTPEKEDDKKEEPTAEDLDALLK